MNKQEETVACIENVLRKIPYDITKYLSAPELCPKYKDYIAEIIVCLHNGGVVRKTDKALPNEIRTPDGNLCYFEELI